MRVAKWRRMLTGCDEARKVRHIDEEQSAHLIANCAEAREIEVARIG
jgi:hypothetical protein